MRISILILFQFFVWLPSFSQNLIANGSFEDENICTELKQRCSPSGWITVVSGSPLYFNSYAIDGKPFTGTHFIQLTAANNKVKEARTFASTRLLCSLRKGNQYNIEFYFRSSFNSLDSIGILLSEIYFLYEKKPFKEIEPTLWMTATGNLNTTWKKHHATFTATGNELFLTIGVFKKLEFEFDVITTNEIEHHLYLDNISLTPVNNHESICPGADSLKYLMYLQNDRHSRLANKRALFINTKQILSKPQQTILKYIDTLIVSDILFKTGSANLEKKTYELLDSLINCIKYKNLDSIVCIGHTDSVGSLAINQQLSAERANNVAEYLKNKLPISDAKIVTYQLAFFKPVESNNSISGRQKNRRVEIYIYRNE